MIDDLPLTGHSDNLSPLLERVHADFRGALSVLASIVPSTDGVDAAAVQDPRDGTPMTSRDIIATTGILEHLVDNIIPDIPEV